MSDWISFYDFKHSVIYVNARHRDVHYRKIAEDIRDYVPSPAAQRARLRLRRGDLGRSGGGGVRASHAGGGRAQCARRAHRALRGNPKISVLTPDEAAALPAARSI